MDRHGRAGIVDEVAGPPVVRSGVLGLLVALLQPNNPYIVQPGGNDDRSNVLVLGLYMLVQLWRHNGLGKIRRTSMLDWNKYRTDLKKRISEIGKLSPDTVRGYATLGNAGAQTNHLDAKTRELIALAVAVTTRCDGCITVHVDAALKHGATREEIAEALGVAVALNAGAALVFSARVMDAVDAHQ